MSTPSDPQDPFEPDRPGAPDDGGQPEGGPGAGEQPPYPGTPLYGPQQPAGSPYPPTAPTAQYGTPQYAGGPQYPGGGPYPAAPQYGDYAQPAPANYLVWAILATVLCCLPLGVVAIVFSSQVNSKWMAGDFPGAQEASRRARLFTIWSVVAGVAAYVVGAIVLVAFASHFSNSTY